MSPQKVLIAENETNLCRVLEAQLTRSGYDVTVVDDGGSAVAAATGPEYDAILLDTELPGVNGLNVLREIRRSGREIPVIVMSADDSHDTVSRLLAAGATACICKPFDLSGLVGLVRSALAEKVGGSPELPEAVADALADSGRLVHLTVYDGASAGWYTTRIERRDGDKLVLACPSRESGYVVLRSGTLVSVGFAGVDAFYSFEATVLPFSGSPASTLVVRMPSVFHRIQRRRYARSPIRMSADLSAFGADGTAPIRADVKDIAIGGLAAVSDVPLHNGMEVDVLVVGETGDRSRLGRGKIVRVQPLSDSRRWEYGIQILGPDAPEITANAEVGVQNAE